MVSSYHEQRLGTAFRYTCQAVSKSLRAAENVVLDPLAAVQMHKKLAGVKAATGGSTFSALADMKPLAEILQKKGLNPGQAIAAMSRPHLENVLAFARVSGSKHWSSLSERDKTVLRGRFLHHTPVNNLANVEPVTTFGTELEIFGLSPERLAFVETAAQQLDGRWINDEDCSIRPDDNTQGREIISPPCTKVELNQIFQVAVMLDALKAKAALPCAMHVHAGIKNTFSSDIRYPFMRQALLNYLEIEKDITKVIGSGEKNYYTYLTQDYPEDFGRGTFKDYLVNMEDMSEGEFIMWMNNPNGRRHSKINFDPLRTYGTIEFRQHPGTVKPAQVTAWVGFVNDFMRASLDMMRKGRVHVASDNERDHLRSLVGKLSHDRATQYEKQSFPLPAPAASPQFAV